MAADMFLKIDTITGESLDAKHKGEIELLSWSWGIANSGTTHAGPGGGGGKANIQDMSFTKRCDTSTPDLMGLCCTGKHFATAKLTVRKAGGNPLEYLIIDFEECMITSYSTGGGGDSQDRILENLTLNFARYKVKYTSQDEKGGAGKSFTQGYNMPEGKPIAA